MSDKIILGLDPGSIVTGFGIIQNGPEKKLITYGVFSLKQQRDPMLRMHMLYSHMITLLQKYAPDEMAIESVFYGSNVQSMLKLGRAQGVAIAAALAYEIPITEYAPCKIKQAITGSGRAAKTQVAAMVGQLLGISLSNTILDASDALAVALCHSQQRLSMAAKAKRWSQFVAMHPHRVVATTL